MSEEFQVAVIGAGPGGYAAAIRAAQRGTTVAIAEKAFIGGTCLNWGCIPSKTLLASAHTLLSFKNANLMGINVAGEVSPNWAKMQARKNAIIQGFRKGLTGLLQGNKVKIFSGTAIVTAPGTITIEGEGGNSEIKAEKIILATGSEPIQIPAFPFDGQTIISSKEALSLDAIPSSMVIIGGGVIGCEMACVYASLGCKVTIVEALSTLVPMEDAWVGQLLEKEFKKLGIECMTSQKVTGVDTSGGTANVQLESGTTIDAEKVLVSVGRRAKIDPQTAENLNLEMAGKVVKIDSKMQTNVPNVYAIGDAVGTTYLAHGAFAEADVAAINATGGDVQMGDYAMVPRAVYTFPEVASVGLNETKAQQQGIETVIGRSFFKANGRSIAHNENTGEIRTITDKKTNKIIGITMVGAIVTELIAAGRALIGSTENIEHISFAHPTVSEVLKESIEDAFGISLHNPPKA